MQEEKYLIGEVSRITGVSKDTLRYYDKIGLLKPTYTAPDTGYRYYTYDQFWAIDIIMCCRSLDISIDEIRTILNARSNTEVINLLVRQKSRIAEKIAYYQRITADIEWYKEQQNQIHETTLKNEVAVRRLPERKVLYGNNPVSTQAYHLRLQELCHQAIGMPKSIRRSYGFVLDERQFYRNRFIKKGEYISLDDQIMSSVDPRYLTTIPEGYYACCIVQVIREQADLTPIFDWLRKEKKIPLYIVADEIGLQLFEYLDTPHLCEVKLLIDAK